MTAIYALGTTHSTQKSKKAVENAFKTHNFDVVLAEGVRGTKKSYHDPEILVKEPFLILCVYIYLRILEKKGTEFHVLKSITRKKKIPYINMDLTMKELIKEFHKWYNYFIYLLLLVIFLFITRNYHILIRIIIAFIVTEIFYFAYFAFSTKRIRDKSFRETSERIIRENNYRKALVVCGKLHKKELKKNFNVIDVV